MCLSVLAAGVLRVPADQAANVTRHEKMFTGTVSAVDAKEHVLEARGLLLQKRFHLGDTCTFTFLAKGSGTLADLHPGQKVSIGYQNADGVLVADRVLQEPLRYEGAVKAIDATRHTLTVHHGVLEKTFRLADDCKVRLYENKSGTLADVQPGEHVTVIYEAPKQGATACEIEQTSATFTGTLTAIDLDERTVKAKGLLGGRVFNLGHDCAIVLSGKPNGHLRDLHPGDKLTLSYNEVSGINIANRIADTGGSSETVTAQTGR
jgi:predicted RNA-binding protein